MDMFADARGYESFMGRWSRLAASRLVDFARIPDAGDVLDIGSGTGSLSLAIEARMPQCRIVGVDRSGEYARFARTCSRDDRVRFAVADAQTLPLRAGSFDACVSLLAFNFVADPEAALAEACRVTEPGGHICAAVWDYGDGMRMLRIFWDAAVALDPAADRVDERHMPLCRAGELYELWIRGGLQDVVECPLEITMQFMDFDDFWSPFVLGQGPAGAFVKRLTSDRVEALCVQLRARLGDPPGAFSLPARLWAVRGAAPHRVSVALGGAGGRR